MLDKEDYSDLRLVRRWLFGLVIGLVVISGAAVVVSRTFDLAWFPWEVKMKTGMIRASNSYITTQQAALRQFRMSYDDPDASPGQKAGIARQMHEIADTLAPDDVQPDIASFLSRH
jgi:hypothetical protein